MAATPFVLRRGRLIAAIVGLAILYVLAGKLGLSLAVVNSSTTAVWPPTGIAIAALLLFGVRLWPGVLLGAFLVNLSTTYGIGSSIGVAIGNTLEAVVAARLVGRFANGPRAFERPYDVFKFAFLAGLLATNLSATIGTTTLGLFGLASWADFGPVWFTWWLGDLGGALLIAPAILVWATDRQGILARPVEKLAVAAITSDALAAAIVDRQRAEEQVRSTEHRLRTVAEEAARLREEFLSIATHELRTPVTSVRGYAQLAQRALERDATADIHKELETIVRQSDRLAALIGQLLDASQLQAGTLSVSPVLTDVSALARQTTTAAQIASSHRLIVDVEPGIWANLDPVRFDEVLTNLI